MHSGHMPDVPSHQSKWQIDQRRAFIEHRLFWRGRLGLSDLMETFGISRSQASTDLNGYIKEFPTHLFYDKSARTYIRGQGFSAHYASIDGSAHLAKLLAMREGASAVRSEWEAFVPDIRAASVPIRTVRAEVARDMLQAIEGGLQLRVDYQSMSSAEAAGRVIEPHAVAHDGFRWHCRAFCLRDNVFKDFVLARIIACDVGDRAVSDPKADSDWNSFLTLRIAPHPGLSDSQRRVVELDYDMRDGVAEIKVRKSMVFYTLRRLGLDVDPRLRRPEDQQIVLVGQTSSSSNAANSASKRFP